MSARSIGYWATTALLAFGVLSGGLFELAHKPENVEGILALGYPEYVVTILGIWKVLGTIVLLAPGLVRLKEWAYAGIFFNMTGAAASHFVSGDEAWHVAVTLFLAGLTMVSWALRPEGRTLGVLFANRTPVAVQRASMESR